MRRLVRKFVSGHARKFVNRLLPTHIVEVLDAVNQSPVIWDEAAVHLSQLRSHVQRIRYPQYLYGLLSAARTARAIGERRFTAIEFGVAGGNGLVAMEQYTEIVEQRFDLQIQLVGFDARSGLPPSTDPRDCPFAFRGGEFPMDEAKLRSRLKRADLRLGDVAQTIAAYVKEDYAPVGFVSNDLDLYTSTRDSFALFHGQHHCLLPRVTMYFDDIMGYPYTSVRGEWAAIHEFNSTSRHRQIGQINGLKHYLGRHYRFAAWTDMFFVLDVFDHPAYNSQEVITMPDLGLRAPE